MKARNLIIAAAVVGIAVGGGVWRTLAGSGPTSFLMGSLRVVAAKADTSGPITHQQALVIIATKLAALEPNVTWDTAYEPTWNVTDVTNMTKVYDIVNGHLLYSRTRPINAVVAELRSGNSWVFGIVSASTFTPVLCKGDGCDPPGTLLDTQAFITP
jgi:hypothetical protein